ncbi:hypothetical protein DYB26_007031 [Aphanomyces astaci]|uniref:HTH CENPB-type domain-containing protein n=2 Tax=Aphanomyces astaci TaxID=112090 RepID=A0A418DAG5_APHAT|nr:hypothetical protein DYB26_007031 [Aphanomyces astaci]
MLQHMALEAAVDEGYSEDEFKAGWHWMVGFKRRHKLSLRARTRVGQDSNEDGIATRQEFSQHVRDFMGEHGVDVVYNADQTAVNYEYFPTKTINDVGEKTVWVTCGGKTKERVTAMVLANSAGTKHPLFLILRTTKSKVKTVVQENLVERQGFGKRRWESVEPMEAKFNCRVSEKSTAWWNGSISLSFLQFHFSDRSDRDTKPVLLLWDDVSAHWTEEVVAYATSINVVLVMFPPRFTWICQPADVAWNHIDTSLSNSYYGIRYEDEDRPSSKVGRSTRYEALSEVKTEDYTPPGRAGALQLAKRFHNMLF